MKVAIYVRVSTNRQTQAQTIDQQLERLRRHLESRGESLAADHIFRDDGLSGANLNRPGLDRLRDRVKGGALDRVLFTSPDGSIAKIGSSGRRDRSGLLTEPGLGSDAE